MHVVVYEALLLKRPLPPACAQDEPPRSPNDPCELVQRGATLGFQDEQSIHIPNQDYFLMIQIRGIDWLWVLVILFLNEYIINLQRHIEP